MSSARKCVSTRSALSQIATRMMEKIIADPLRKKQLELRIPANRLQHAGGSGRRRCLRLLSDHSRRVSTALVITVDGGETAGLRTPRVADISDG